jgi:hypothetical protein
VFRRGGDFALGELAPVSPDFPGCGTAPTAIREFAGSNQLEHAAQPGSVFGGRSRCCQSGQSGIHYVLRTRKTQPSRIELVFFGCRIHHRPNQIVADYGEYQLFSPFSANRCSSSTILEAPTLQASQLASENPEKRL